MSDLRAPVGAICYRPEGDDRGWYVKGTDDRWHKTDEPEVVARKVRERDALVTTLLDWCEQMRTERSVMGNLLAAEIERRMHAALAEAAKELAQ